MLKYPSDHSVNRWAGFQVPFSMSTLSTHTSAKSLFGTPFSADKSSRLLERTTIGVLIKIGTPCSLMLDLVCLSCDVYKK
mmetsp:Transcript_882/g.1937  ORF Transcript_882/g.1937 Transcript_882/m.1937 type:complete len:80 (-) Transcript_882:1401-1640(-)